MADPGVARGTGRARAVATARRLFAERGYDATSIADVLQDGNLSKGALYHHFTSKTELFVAVLEEVEGELLGRLAQRAANAASPLESVRAGALGFLDEALRPEVRRVVLVDAPAVLGWARWRELDKQYAFGALRAGIASAVAAGEFDLQPDLVDAYAHLLLASLLELALLIIEAPDPTSERVKSAALIDTLLADREHRR